ncbi:MAG: hypothetical protein JSS81_07260 [Acidobacteria bacterium]|nr:hypothetical protein [Acidobacteriota bacterium]
MKALIQKFTGDLEGRPWFYHSGEGSFRLFTWISGQLVWWGMKYGRGRHGWCKPAIGLDFYCGDRNLDFRFHIGLIFFTFYLTFEDVLPRRFQPGYISTYDKKTRLASKREFRLYYLDRAIWLNLWDNEDEHTAKQKWINRMHVFRFPWNYDWIRTSKLLADGSWYHDTYKNRLPWKEKNAIEKTLDFFKETHPYRYVLRSGEAQDVSATIGVTEQEWRWRSRLFKWLGWPKKVRRTISVEFSDEVGEERGSWKGGTVGCGYELKDDETPLECLRRMERERRFER